MTDKSAVVSGTHSRGSVSLVEPFSWLAFAPPWALAR
jgi:hypothetical protein